MHILHMIYVFMHHVDVMLLPRRALLQPLHNGACEAHYSTACSYCNNTQDTERLPACAAGWVLRHTIHTKDCALKPIMCELVHRGC